MTKTKVNLAFQLFSTVLILVLSGSRSQPDDSFAEHLKAVLMQYDHDYREERAFLLTDRFVYKPGEDVWFKGYVMSVGGRPAEPNSEDFFIKLFNNKGEEIISRRYPLKDNQTTGRLLIPRSSIPGRYCLVAYTGWMKNQCPQEVFRKEILISKYYDKRFHVEPLYNRTVYYPGDSMDVTLRILDQEGGAVPETEYEYFIGSLRQREIKGSGETDSRGFSHIKCVIPVSDDLLMLTIGIKSRKLSGDYTMIIPAVTGIPEISFFPEGGRIVKGLPARIAVRATVAYGIPAIISGEIVDRNGRIIQTVNTNYKGKGVFDFEPQDDTCYLILTRPSDISVRYPLPMADERGWVIRFDKQEKDSLHFKITSSMAGFPETSHWVISAGHQVVWSKEISFNGSARVIIPAEKLKKGILQLSVFNQDHELVADRLFNLPSLSEPLRIKTDHNIYRSRQRVNLSVEYTGTSGSTDLALVVSLRNLSTTPLQPHLNDVAGLVYCDSLKGYRPHDMVTDLDLLTTHYRAVYWNTMLSARVDGRTYSRNDGITGKVLDKKDNVSQHAKVRVTHIPNYRAYETQTDENGVFQVVFGTDIIDFNYLNVDAYDALGKINLVASIDQTFSQTIRDIIMQKDESSEMQKTIDVASYGETDLVYALRYGPGKFRKNANETRKKYDPNQYTDYTSVMDIIQDIKPYRVENNMLIFIPQEPYSPRPVVQEGSIIVINGSLKGHKVDILNNLMPSDITNINISTSLIDVHKYTPINFQAVIEITTIQGMYKYRQPTVQLGMDILNTNRQFYSPDYSVESITSADNRKTLYWNPNLRLQAEQSALLSFYTSDVKGVYYGVAEGTDESGNPVRAEFSFVVE